MPLVLLQERKRREEAIFLKISSVKKASHQGRVQSSEFSALVLLAFLGVVCVAQMRRDGT